MALEDDFQKAAEESKQLPERPGNDDMLKLYSLYKQGSQGDVTGESPGMMDFVGHAKFTAWEERKGMAREDAMQQYIDLVEHLKGT
ncbi:MAG: acyl-CoA-binding protein [SAR324 cluster bacterium]|nr:acyl-CoA-binding protein [SAR324 cluster bacterium]